MTRAVRVILSHLQDPCRAWLEAALEHASVDELQQRFSEAARFAHEPVTPGGDPAWLFRGAPADELVRVCLVLCAMECVRDPRVLAREWYRTGDNGEKRAIMRALPLADRAEQHAHLASIGCRSSVQTVFEGISCENPYPSLYFGDAAFNQMVLKAYFTGVEVDRIIGLDRRRNPDLRRMADDYASERRAAGRSVPADLHRARGEAR